MTASFSSAAATAATLGTLKIVGTPADAANPKVPVISGAGGDVGKTFDASTGALLSVASASALASEITRATTAEATAISASQQRFPVAAPTGVAATDTANIQAAITSATTAGGGVVLLGSGIYAINAALVLASSVALEGAGQNLRDTTKGTILKTATNSTLAGAAIITFTPTVSALNWRVSNLVLASAEAVTSGNPNPLLNTAAGISDLAAMTTRQAGQGTIEHVTFWNLGGDAIALSGNVNMIRHNQGVECGGHFIYCKNSSTGPGVATDGHILNNDPGQCVGSSYAPGSFKDAIRIDGGGYMTVMGNHLDNHSIGINLLNAYNCRVIGNRCEKADIDGIVLNGGAGHQVVGNHLWNNGFVSGKRGIYLTGTTRNVVNSNHIQNVTTDASGLLTDIGISLSTSDRNLIGNNLIENVNTNGIYMTASTYNVLTGNLVFTVGKEGVLLTNACNYNSVSGNTIDTAGQLTDNTYDALVLPNTTNVGNTLSGNTVRHGGGAARSRYALNVGGATNSNTTVTDNDCLVGGRAAPPLADSGTSTFLRNNRGYATEAQGLATVASGTTSIAVTHGLNFTPTVRNINLKPTNNLGSATKWWISNVTGTQFTINVDVDPGATTATFAWNAGIYA